MRNITLYSVNRSLSTVNWLYSTHLKMAIKNGLFVILMIWAIALCLGLPIKRKRATTGVGAVSVITLNLLEDTLKNGTKITQTAIKLIEKNLEKLNNLMDEADINIRKIQNATEEIELENIQITKEFLDQYYLSKGELREARQTLRHVEFLEQGMHKGSFTNYVDMTR